MAWGLTYRGVHSSEKGLRFTNISGRDTLPDIESRTSQTASKHGVHYFGYRFQERRIRAEIALHGSSLSNFRSKIRDIAAWLNPHEGPGELIFDDEPDKKYFAVITDNTDFEGMFIKRVAEIEFLCPDPFAYAISETTATISGNSLTINNDGTAETFPVIEITADGTAGPDNLEGKIQGSTVENPHVYKRSSFSTGFYTSLQNPNSFSIEGSTNDYDLIASLGKTPLPVSNSNYSAISQQLFSFNLIALIKRKFGFTVPGANLAEQVQWLKTNISQITANWWGKGTNKQADPIGIANFVGKVSGSTVENPNSSKYFYLQTTLQTPSTSGLEPSTQRYGEISTLNNISWVVSGSGSGAIAQHLFSFNLIEYVQRKYGVTVPGATTADKVQWLKDNLNIVRCHWHGYGEGASGNKAYIARWFVLESRWYTEYQQSHTSGSVSLLKNTATNPPTFVDSSGFCHFLVYTDAANDTTPSIINTDYVELEVELKAGEDKASLANWRADVLEWSIPVTHSSPVIDDLSLTVTTAVPYRIDTSGFVHYLAYAEPSNGISPSTIETDYIEIQVKLSKIEGIKVSNGSEFIAIQRSLATGDKVKIDNERGTITLNGTTDIISSLDIDSDFFAIKSGSSTLTVGGGNGTVRYTKRWL